MIKLNVSDEIRNVCPGFSGAAILASVVNSEYDELLWAEIDFFCQHYAESHAIEDIKTNSAISATRKAYKLLGKDPNRYRPSGESLCRRIVRGLPLYKVNTLVDLINLVSLKTGYSIGGFDLQKISGDTLTLGVGQPEEPYEGIGRGMLNIEGLPVYRDNLGGIGTPTSDHERTKLDLNTISLLTIINGYSGQKGLNEAVCIMQDLLRKYASSDGGCVIYF